MVVVVLACVWGLRTFVIAPYEIPSGSMETTVIMTGDRIGEDHLLPRCDVHDISTTR